VLGTAEISQKANEIEKSHLIAPNRTKDGKAGTECVWQPERGRLVREFQGHRVETGGRALCGPEPIRANPT